IGKLPIPLRQQLVGGELFACRQHRIDLLQIDRCGGGRRGAIFVFFGFRRGLDRPAATPVSKRRLVFVGFFFRFEIRRRYRGFPWFDRSRRVAYGRGFIFVFFRLRFLCFEGRFFLCFGNG